MIELGLAGVICASLLVGLVLVLRHLTAMRVTSGEIATLATQASAAFGNIDARFEATDRRLADLDTRLVHLNNRTQR